jgi:hypothetical protein
MRLFKPFCRLPLRFDAERLRYEVMALPAEAWARHPSGYAGNSALRLITTDGGENDDVVGEMKPTPWLARCPYLQQVLGSFGVVWSRSRLMKLAPRSVVPQHCDVNYHWHHRVRIHIPIVTFPEVRFHCDDQSVHMAAGEAWIFDNWRPHRVENGADQERIHLVADTMGNESFWNMAQAGQWEGFDVPPVTPPTLLPYRAEMPPPLLTERYNAATVMPPAELESLVATHLKDLGTRDADAASKQALALYKQALRGFCSEWRQLWSLFGDGMPGWPHYARLRQQLQGRLDAVAVPIHMWSNQVLARQALQAGILAHVLNPPGAQERGENEYGDQPQAAGKARPAAPRHVKVERPVFIVAAPRSGSTLLFETLAQSSSLWTVGGEAHGMVEKFPALRPGAPGVTSNRLTAAQATPEVAQGVLEHIARKVRNARGEPPLEGAAIRFLEKTPKNALRVPFFRAMFPDALFVHLWRDPRENLSSIMEAWRAGGWVTYPQLPGWDGPWSLLLPPGWEEMRGRPLEEVAALQWRVANDIILQDLAAVPAGQRMALSYADFMADPAAAVRGIFDFAGLAVDDALRARIEAPLPLSRHTLTPPGAEKWRKNEAEILRVLPTLEPTWARLRALAAPAPAETA